MPIGSKQQQYIVFILKAAIASFITYLCMYAYRKPFTAAAFEGISFLGIDYKILLIISQLIGYTLSKYLGIKIISEYSPDRDFSLFSFAQSLQIELWPTMLRGDVWRK